MFKSIAAAARLGILVATVCLTGVSCSPGGSQPTATSTVTPLTTATATRQTATPIPQVSPTAETAAASRALVSPSPAPLAIYLPADYDSTRTAWRDIHAALKKAAVDHEPVLLDFGSSWCPSCAQLEQSFQAPEVQALVASLHLVHVDTGPRYEAINMDIAAAYGLYLEKTGLPGLVLLSPQGKVDATTNNGLFDNSLPNSPSEIIGFLKPYL